MSILDNRSFQTVIICAILVALFALIFWAGFWMTLSLTLLSMVAS